jgi:predicted SAM-dependent methyltransferase
MEGPRKRCHREHPSHQLLTSIEANPREGGETDDRDIAKTSRGCEASSWVSWRSAGVSVPREGFGRRGDGLVPQFVSVVKRSRFSGWLDVARKGVEVANRPIASARLRRALASSAGSNLRIHVGAGRVKLRGWLNTDASWRAHLYLDVTRPWPTNTGRVAFIYGDNVIEHMRLDDARAFLRYAFVALRPGGVIRLATPDIQAIARTYLDDPVGSEMLLRWHRRGGRLADHRVDHLRIYFTEWGHARGYMYDESALGAELVAAGYANPHRVGVGASAHPELCGLEGRVDEEAAIQLVMEATKPRVE